MNVADQTLQNSDMEANAPIKKAGTQLFHHTGQSAPDFESSSDLPSGSAVSALQSKFKERSQRRSKGTETHVLLKDPPEALKKPDKEQSPLSIAEVKIFNMCSSDEVSEVQGFVTPSQLTEKKWQQDSIPSFDNEFGEGSRIEDFIKIGDGGTLLSKPTSSPRYWTPPKGFWRVARREEQNFKFRGTALHKDLQGLDSVKSTSTQRCFQDEQVPLDEPRKEDSSEAEITKPTSAMFAEGQYPPPNKDLPPSYKETDWDTTISCRSGFNIRSDLTISPRHERAKRLLERARSKAHSQNQHNDQGTSSIQTEVLEMLPMHTPPPKIITTTHEQKGKLLYVPGRNSEHGGHLRRQGQLGLVHFEEESQNATERHCQSRVLKHKPMLIDILLSSQPKAPLPLAVPQDIKGLGSSQDSAGIPLAIHGYQGDPFIKTVLCKSEPQKCKACGNILTLNHSKESRQNADGLRNSGNQWDTSGQQIVKPSRLEGTMLTGSSSLDDNVMAAEESDAGERASAFGKLRRRSRKGENRVEASFGPYARGQDLLAQRRNSRTRSSLEEVAGPRSKPARGVRFATDSFTPRATISRNCRDSAGIHLPIKSALKSGSKSRPIEQLGVKTLSSVQEVEKSPHHAVATPQDLGAPSQVSQVSSGLIPCFKSSSFKYLLPVVAPVESLDVLLPSEDSTCAASRPTENWPIVRGAAMSKTEDLRAELLRSVHRKAELQWDENLAASRKTLERDGRPKLSLRRFFSAMGLNSMGKMVKGSRSSSMEHLSHFTARASPSPTHKGQTLLQRTPSLQTLNMATYQESPLAQLRKASSVQSLQSPKKKYERSAVPGELHLPLPFGTRDHYNKKGMEILDAPQPSGPMGRILQTFPDGSLLLELTRPVNAPFGFVICKGKGRPDSGIYVEQVGGGTTENIYTSLLAVGDEILEVNGEKVTGLSLDQVTCLMTRESSATVRIVPHRWIQH
ncbi:hypothetical protein C0J50_4376 [Silurus asotus]|uniref:PDZ domain-containing protein n=1 Tax=Silurus asotus TaxID=30991 RepID=A0AAD5FEH0_SILAS|nr:hypothetical protein C0J50_4376 [Silurus asotus]